jgi:HK97 family phage major capsid protein
MKTAKLIQLERDRLVAIDEARSILADLEIATDEKRARELGKKHDTAMRKLDLIGLDIEEETLRASGPDTDARRRQRPVDDTDIDHRDTETNSGWSQRNGEEIRVLKPHQRVSTEHHEGLRLGDTLRALITGPRNDAERRALSEGTDSAGGFTVPDILASQFIDRLRANSVVIRAGARTVPMISDNLSIARQETDPTVAWRNENAAITESDPTFGRVTLQARSLMGMVRLSRELADDSVNVSAMLENAFIQAMAVEFDRAMLYGSGTAPEPRGVSNTSGIGSVSMGVNGATLTNYDNIIDTIYAIQLANAADPTAMIYHPRTGASLAKLKDGQSNPLTVPEMVRKVPALTTTSAPITETQGTATSQCSSIILGNFSEMLIGLRMQLRIVVLQERYADTNQLGIVAGMRGDMQLAHPASFAKLIGVKP